MGRSAGGRPQADARGGDVARGTALFCHPPPAHLHATPEFDTRLLPGGLDSGSALGMLCSPLPRLTSLTLHLLSSLAGGRPGHQQRAGCLRTHGGEGHVPGGPSRGGADGGWHWVTALVHGLPEGLLRMRCLRQGLGRRGCSKGSAGPAVLLWGSAAARRRRHAGMWVRRRKLAGVGGGALASIARPPASPALPLAAGSP